MNPPWMFGNATLRSLDHQVREKNTVMEPVAWTGSILPELLGENNEFQMTERCVVMTRRIRWLARNSRTTVISQDEWNKTPGFIVYWNTNDQVVLDNVHRGMVEVIKRIGYSKPAFWCDDQYKHPAGNYLKDFWRDQLGDLYCYFRKAT
jgi:hypothetical protein